MTNTTELRLRREADALAIVKAMRRSPGAPVEPAKPLSPTHIAGRPDAPGLVYFVYCGGRIKIGYTAEIGNRMANLASNCPAPATLLLTIGGDEEDETDYHEMFAADRVHREWFRLSYDLREFMETKFGHETFPLLFEAEYDFREMSLAATAHVVSMLELR